MKNGIKTSQQLIVNMLKSKKPQHSKNSNKIQSNNNGIVVSFKHSLITQNLNGNMKGGGIIIANNLTNRTKYKTTKNSPERLFLQKNLSRQKNIIGFNQAFKPSSKMPINNSINSINKMILQSQRNNNTMKEEIIKKKILQIKEKKNMTTMNSNNNSMSLSNSINHNYIHNNSNNNLGLYINKLKSKNKRNDINFQNRLKSSINQQPNSYREIKKRSNSNYELENNINNNLNYKNMKNGQFINCGKKGKYYNLINKYISSASSSSKQPQRQQHQKSLKNKFNTITAKKGVDIYKQNSNNNTNSCRGAMSALENTNIINSNFNYVSKKKNNFHKQNIKNNFLFSSTINSLYKPKQQQKQVTNFHFDMKTINKTSYPSKQNSRKHSSEKSAQNSMNHSSINHIINSSSSNYFIKNYNSPAITVNNHRKSDILNKKANYLNNGNINFISNIYNYSNNKNNISNGMYNFKYRFNGVYSSSNSKEYSKDNNKKKNNLNNITDLKRCNVQKIINQLYKHKDNNLNAKNNVCNNNFINFNKEKDQENQYSLNSNNHLNNLYSSRGTKDKKDTSRSVGTNVHHVKKMSENINRNIINKLNINGDNNNLLNKNKDISPTDTKTNKNISNGIINQNYSARHIKNSDNKDKDNMNKFHKLESYLNQKKKEEKNLNENNCEKNANKNKKDDDNNPKEINYSKNIRDKDLSYSENENDSLLEYVNNNIDYIPNVNNSINTEISENESMLSTLKENGKFTCYNRDMEIISNYLKNYYKKYKKYPRTKMKFYKYGRLLGKGAFGKVNLSLHLLTGRLVAIKSINKEKITTERQKQKIKLETTIMKRLSKSNNIVKIFETYETKKHICIVMEYICAGDLLSYIKKRSKLQEPVAKFIFKQIILALKFIHENKIVHRDIKLDNILIDLDNNIKICDFGVSKIVNKGDVMLEQCGTPAYIAPEILLNKGYEGFGVDVWSAGVVLYAMLSGTVPFKGSNIKELHNLIISGNYPVLKDISNNASHLIKNILEIDPKKRITTENILCHPWLIDVDLNFWKTQNLFTNAEYVLLAKSNVDYRNIANKEDMIENFDIRNLDTADENINKNVHTKSFILAPFNTSMTDDENNTFPKYNNISFNNKLEKKKEITDFNNPDLKILNGAIKYVAKVKDLNRNYELNNNQEIDNGVVILPNDSDEKNKKENDISPLNGSYNNNKVCTKPFSAPNEIEEVNNDNKKKEKDEINEKALEILENLGYKKSFVKESIINNNFNYATASYRLIVKYCFS
mgnify:CR=1 FL=1